MDERKRKHRRFPLSALREKIGGDGHVESDRPSGVNAEVIGRSSAIHLELGESTINVFELALIVVEPSLL